MHSFLQHSTNMSFAKMLQLEKQQRPPNILKEAANTSFDAIIDAKLSPAEKKVHGSYKIPAKSFPTSSIGNQVYSFASRMDIGVIFQLI